jgi:hypothetical protein
MNIGRKTLIVIMIITGFIFAVSFATLYVQTHIVEGTACSCTLPIPVLIPTFSSLGVFVGSFVYYLIFSKIEKNERESTREARDLLELLQNDEKKIILNIVENGGEMLQSKLSRKFGKVKTFRTLEGLRKRGIVTKEKHGRTNKIKLKPGYKDILCF